MALWGWGIDSGHRFPDLRQIGKFVFWDRRAGHLRDLVHHEVGAVKITGQSSEKSFWVLISGTHSNRQQKVRTDRVARCWLRNANHSACARLWFELDTRPGGKNIVGFFRDLISACFLHCRYGAGCMSLPWWALLFFRIETECHSILPSCPSDCGMKANAYGAAAHDPSAWVAFHPSWLRRAI